MLNFFNTLQDVCSFRVVRIRSVLILEVFVKEVIRALQKTSFLAAKMMSVEPVIFYI